MVSTRMYGFAQTEYQQQHTHTLKTAEKQRFFENNAITIFNSEIHKCLFTVKNCVKV